MNTTTFEGWAIIELMGHAKIAGQCSETPLAGTNMLRVDVPAHQDKAAFTRFFGGSAIYSITPTDEATVRIALAHFDARPVDQWIVPDRVTPKRGNALPPADWPEDEDDDHDAEGFAA